MQSSTAPLKLLSLAAQLRTKSTSVPLLEGDRGTEQTVALIRELVDEALKSPAVNRRAVDYLRGVPAYDPMAEVTAIYQGVLRDFRFTNDPIGKETLRPAEAILELGAGDCDDINGVLLPALLGSVGYPTRLVTISSNPIAPDDFTHIYAEVLVNGDWIPVDAARPGTAFGFAPPTFFRKRVWSITADEYEDLSGACPPCGLAGYVDGLGQDDAADVISAIASGVAQNIRAAKGQPVYSSFPPTAPIYSSTAPIYRSAAQQETSPWVWIALGVGALFLLGSMNR